MQNKSFARIEGRRQEELYEDVEFDAMRCTASEADHLHASAMYSVKMWDVTYLACWPSLWWLLDSAKSKVIYLKDQTPSWLGLYWDPLYLLFGLLRCCRLGGLGYGKVVQDGANKATAPSGLSGRISLIRWSWQWKELWNEVHWSCIIGREGESRFHGGTDEVEMFIDGWWNGWSGGEEGGGGRGSPGWLTLTDSHQWVIAKW